MKACRHGLTVVLIATIVISVELNARANPACIDYKQLDAQLRAVVTNIHTSDKDILDAISHFGRCTEGPAFWTQIANNTNYSTLHRTRCVMALFRRYAQGEVEMYSVSTCIQPAKWLEQSAIYKLDLNDMLLPGSSCPLQPKEGDSVFKIEVLNTPHEIYIRIKGDVSLERFISQLKGGSFVSSPRKKEEDPLWIDQWAYVDDYERWFNGYPFAPQ
jgi:hypothetical protein